MSSRVVFVVVLATASAFRHVPLAQSADWTDGLARVSMDDRGREMPYRLYLPPGYDEAASEFPVVVYLHGASTRGSDNESHVAVWIDGLIEATQTERFASFLVAPQVPSGRNWWDHASVRNQAFEIIDQIIEEFPIDSRRVYLTGLSMGGSGTYSLVRQRQEYFAAAVPIAAGWGQFDSEAPRLQNTPMWVFHGRKDEVVSVNDSRNMVSALNRLGASPLYTEDDTTHCCFDAVYSDEDDNLYNWMFAQARDTFHIGGWQTIGTHRHSDLVNLAVDGVATQSSTRRDNERYAASVAIDGDFDPRNAAYTASAMVDHWWRVDLDSLHPLSGLRIHNHSLYGKGLTDGGGFRVTVLDDHGDASWQRDFVDAPFQHPFEIDFRSEGTPIQGTTIRLSRLEAMDQGTATAFGLVEVEVLGERFDSKDLRLEKSQVLHFEIDVESGTADRLDVTGTLDLGGSTLRVLNLSGDFVGGASFDLLEFGAIENTFDKVDLPLLSSGLAWDQSELYSEGTLSVVDVPTELLPGDANQDLIFDQLDLVQVLQAGKYLTGEAATWGEGDWNGAPGGSPGHPPQGDGLFNQLDIVAAQQAAIYLAGASAGRHEETLAAVVPEPGSLMLLAVGLLGLVARERRSLAYYRQNRRPRSLPQAKQWPEPPGWGPSGVG